MTDMRMSMSRRHARPGHADGPLVRVRLGIVDNLVRELEWMAERVQFDEGNWRERAAEAAGDEPAGEDVERWMELADLARARVEQLLLAARELDDVAVHGRIQERHRALGWRRWLRVLRA